MTDKKIYSIEIEDTKIIKGDYAQSHYLQKLNEVLEEVFILSTCQRYVIVSFCNSIEELISMANQVFEKVIIKKIMNTAEKTAEYLFQTAVGARSEIYGEHEIIGQIRKQYKIADRERCIGVNLNELIGHTIKCGKIVRTQTNIGALQISYVSLAFQKIKELSDKDFVDMKYLVVGTGHLAIQVLTGLKSRNVGQIDISSHSNERAIKLANKIGVRSKKINEIEFNHYDVIIGCTHGEIDFMYHFSSIENCPRHIIDALKEQVIIDFGEPENFPIIKKSGSKNYVDLEEIMAMSVSSLAVRKRETPVVNAIILKEVKIYLNKYNQRKMAPLLGGYWRKLQKIQEQELEWLMPKFKGSEKEKELLKKFSHRLLRKISKDTFRAIRDMSGNEHSNNIQIELLNNAINSEK